MKRTNVELFRPRRKLALLLPGHNEELIISTTIKSAIASGQLKRDIYVVNDASTDNTRVIAEQMLGKANVLNVHRSGKALAVQKAIKKFKIESQYQWLHVADADSVFGANYFRIYRRELSSQHVVALGFVQSLKGNWISTYRSFNYTYGQQVYRRIQSALGMIAIFPGPVTSFRTDILRHLDLKADSLTEDFDITLQVHRKNLGKILFIPGAVSYTQDPQTLADFSKQSMRWYRGIFQGVRQHNVGFRRQRIDVAIGVPLLQTFFFLFQALVLYPLILLQTHNWLLLPAAIAIDIIVTDCLLLFSAIAIRRWNILGILPYYYFLRFFELGMYYWAFTEVILLRRYRNSPQGWSTAGRRYRLGMGALKDARRLKTA